MTELSRDGEPLDGVEVMRGAKAGRDARQVFVECTDCKEISKCTPFNDFYEKPDDPDAHVCEKCFCSHHGLRPDPITVIVPDGTELKKGDRLRWSPKDFCLKMVSWVKDPVDPMCKIDPSKVVDKKSN